jgi:hypothetical protein
MVGVRDRVSGDGMTDEKIPHPVSLCNSEGGGVMGNLDKIVEKM